MVSQVGFTGTTGGFGNHYNIYYYWYPDTNGAAIYLNTTETATASLDLAYKRTYSPTRDAVPVDMEMHYVLGKDNMALYVYMIASHPTRYSTYGDINISFMQMI